MALSSYRSKPFKNNLAYITPSQVSITKTLKYTVPNTPSALTKTLIYGVKITQPAITMAIQYEIFDPHTHKVYIRPNTLKPRMFSPGLAR